jgi:RNA:NAD 2'-phosphotransferase (TPT1/KptA family)
MSLIEKHFDMSISKDEFIYITKDLSGGIFKLSNDGSKICARHGHSFIYNLNVPEGFEPCVELPRELYFNISSNDFMANMKSDAIPLSNKKIVLTKHVPQKINATVTCKLNSQNIDLKTVKFYYNKNDDTFFTLVVPKNLVAIHV